jgi:hypothetical protein
MPQNVVDAYFNWKNLGIEALLLGMQLPIFLHGCIGGKGGKEYYHIHGIEPTAVELKSLFS